MERGLVNFWASGLAAVHMEVEVLGILVAPKVCENAASAMFLLDVRCHLCNDIHDLHKKTCRGITKVGERGDMVLGNHDDMNGPEWLCVMERQYIVGL